MFVTKLAKSLIELIADHTDTAYALNTFYDTGADIILLNFFLPSLYIIEGEVSNMSVGIDGGNNLRVIGCLYSQ